MDKSRDLVVAAMEDWPKAMWKGIELDVNDDMGLDDWVFSDRMRFIGAMTNKVTVNTDKMGKIYWPRSIEGWISSRRITVVSA